MNLQPVDLINIERELGSRSFKHFVRMAWHVVEPVTVLRWGWALDAMCDHLQAVSEGQINRLLINVPPGMMKSLLMNVFWPAWEWINRKDNKGQYTIPALKKIGGHLRYLSTAHAEKLALRDNLKCRRLIESAWYQQRWPIKLTTDQNTKSKFENEHTGFREAMAFTSMTGSRGDRVLLDDPLSVDDAHSVAAIDACETTFNESLPTRVNTDESAIVITMQRLNERDPSGIILAKKLNYVHLMLPMYFEPARRCVTPIFSDPRTVEGELLFPERFPPATLAELEKSLGSYGKASQFQQRPAPAGGGIFKDQWWIQYNELPLVKWRMIYADTAQKTGQLNDFAVFQCWGMLYDGRIALIDQVRDKWEAPELLTTARAFWNKHAAELPAAPLRQMKVEDKSSGTGLIQQLQRGDASKGVKAIPVVGIPRDRDKVSRAHDAAPKIEAGLVLIPANAPFLSDYLTEHRTFPNGAHDDMIDPTMDAIADMLGGKSTDWSKVN